MKICRNNSRRPIIARCCAIVLASFSLVGSGGTAAAARNATGGHVQVARSLYLSLHRNRVVSSRKVLLSARLVLPHADTVLLESDGSYAPIGTDAASSISICVDGRPVSNESTTDWRGGFDVVAHSFDAIGATSLPAGSHTVELVGVALAGSFTVDALSNLSVFVHPAQNVLMSQLPAQPGPFDFTTLGDVGPDLPHTPLVQLPTDVTQPTVALGSGSERRVGPENGDGMLGIYLDGQHPGTSHSLWTVNDLCICAETEAPLFTHALLQGTTHASTVSLDATEFPWSRAQGENPGVFTVQPRATLVVLNGGLHAVGAAQSLLRSFPDLAGTVYDHWCIGSNQGWPGCPTVGSAVPIAKATISIAAGRPGVVMLLAKARVSGDESDPGGTATLWITVDGKPRGSIGLQQLAAPSGESGRTITASYLAAGNAHLRPGRHTIRVYAKADGAFIHLAYLRDVPLVWFD